MEFTSWLVDQKIRGINVAVTLSLGEYWALARNVLDMNPIQRARVRSKYKPYELLKRDLVEGCVMPPIILAVTEEYGKAIHPLVDKIVNDGHVSAEQKDDLEQFLRSAFQQYGLIILDGLQRTYSIQEVLSQLEGVERERVLGKPMRVEIYAGLSKMGILYRMLTLNTAQTPMPFRHQIEIMYHDYIDSSALPGGIRVVRQAEGAYARGVGRYRYSDVVDMFYAYSAGSPRSADRQSIVDQLKELNFLEEYRSNSEDMLVLLVVFNTFLKHLEAVSEGWTFSDEAISTVERPFGENAPSLFAKNQVMVGFGAACRKSIRAGSYNSIAEIGEALNLTRFQDDDPSSSLNLLVHYLNEINKKAKKIGNEQRAYFDLSFRQLLLPDSDAHLNLSGCWTAGYEKYELMF